MQRSEAMLVRSRFNCRRYQLWSKALANGEHHRHQVAIFSLKRLVAYFDPATRYVVVDVRLGKRPAPPV